VDGEIVVWVVYWLIMARLSYWLAKRKGFNIRLWTILGVLFGPCALIILAVKKKSSESSNLQSLTDQAVEGIRTLKYSVDNATSKIGGTDAFKSGNKIANEIKGIFKKR
jgi:ABC-type bacteriocin/lantibiotic exporter with double-glycine peptidase domain